MVSLVTIQGSLTEASAELKYRLWHKEEGACTVQLHFLLVTLFPFFARQLAEGF